MSGLQGRGWIASQLSSADWELNPRVWKPQNHGNQWWSPIWGQGYEGPWSVARGAHARMLKVESDTQAMAAPTGTLAKGESSCVHQLASSFLYFCFSGPQPIGQWDPHSRMVPPTQLPLHTSVISNYTFRNAPASVLYWSIYPSVLFHWKSRLTTTGIY